MGVLLHLLKPAFATMSYKLAANRQSTSVRSHPGKLAIWLDPTSRIPEDRVIVAWLGSRYRTRRKRHNVFKVLKHKLCS